MCFIVVYTNTSSSALDVAGCIVSHVVPLELVEDVEVVDLAEAVEAVEVEVRRSQVCRCAFVLRINTYLSKLDGLPYQRPSHLVCMNTEHPLTPKLLKSL